MPSPVVMEQRHLLARSLLPALLVLVAPGEAVEGVVGVDQHHPVRPEEGLGTARVEVGQRGVDVEAAPAVLLHVVGVGVGAGGVSLKKLLNYL